jgi:hypothetical protein
MVADIVRGDVMRKGIVELVKDADNHLREADIRGRVFILGQEENGAPKYVIKKMLLQGKRRLMQRPPRLCGL